MSRTLSARRAWLGPATGIVVLAFVLRVHRLGAQELWVDEAFSYFMATRHDWFRFALVDSTPPLYYLLLRGWTSIAGASDFALRLPSAFFGTATVAAIVGCGNLIFGRGVALWAGLFAAVAPIHVYYSQEARAYSLLILLLTVLVALLWRAVDGESVGRWVAFSACASLALHTHYFAAIVLGATLVVPVARGERAKLRPAVLSLLVAGLSILPWVAMNLRAKAALPAAGSPIAWIARVWEATPPLLAIPKSLEILGLGVRKGLIPLALKQASLVEEPQALRVVGLVVLLGLGVLAASVPGERDRRGLRSVAFLLAAPLVGLWMVSFVRPLYVAGRSDVLVFPAYALLVGVGLARLGSLSRVTAWLAPLVFAILLAPIVVKLDRYYAHPPTTRRSETATVLDARTAPGDVVVFTGLRGLGALHALERLGTRWQDGTCTSRGGRRYGCRLFPRTTETVLAASVDGKAESPEEVRADLEDYLRALAAAGGRVWLVLDEPSDADAALTREIASRGFRATEALRSLRIVIYERSP